MKSCSASPFLLAHAKNQTPMMDYATVPTSELIRACVDGQAAAWQDFIRRFNRIVAITSYRVARRWSEASPAVVDDLTQETYLMLCADGARVLREFDSQDPEAIFAFLKVVTANVANDYFKRVYAGKRAANQKNEIFDDEYRIGSVAGPSSPSSGEHAAFLANESGG